MAAGLDDLAQPGIDALDGIGRIDQAMRAGERMQIVAGVRA
jgi:hypothetical protein